MADTHHHRCHHVHSHLTHHHRCHHAHIHSHDHAASAHTGTGTPGQSVRTVSPMARIPPDHLDFTPSSTITAAGTSAISSMHQQPSNRTGYGALQLHVDRGHVGSDSSSLLLPSKPPDRLEDPSLAVTAASGVSGKPSLQHQHHGDGDAWALQAAAATARTVVFGDGVDPADHPTAARLAAASAPLHPMQFAVRTLSAAPATPPLGSAPIIPAHVIPAEPVVDPSLPLSAPARNSDVGFGTSELLRDPSLPHSLASAAVAAAVPPAAHPHEVQVFTAKDVSGYSGPHPHILKTVHANTVLDGACASVKQTEKNARDLEALALVKSRLERQTARPALDLASDASAVQVAVSPRRGSASASEPDSEVAVTLRMLELRRQRGESGPESVGVSARRGRGRRTMTARELAESAVRLSSSRRSVSQSNHHPKRHQEPSAAENTAARSVPAQSSVGNVDKSKNPNASARPSTNGANAAPSARPSTNGANAAPSARPSTNGANAAPSPVRPTAAAESTCAKPSPIVLKSPRGDTRSKVAFSSEKKGTQVVGSIPVKVLAIGGAAVALAKSPSVSPSRTMPEDLPPPPPPPTLSDISRASMSSSKSSPRRAPSTSAVSNASAPSSRKVSTAVHMDEVSRTTSPRIASSSSAVAAWAKPNVPVPVVRPKHPRNWGSSPIGKNAPPATARERAKLVSSPSPCRYHSPTRERERERQYEVEGSSPRPVRALSKETLSAGARSPPRRISRSSPLVRSPSLPRYDGHQVTQRLESLTRAVMANASEVERLRRRVSRRSRSQPRRQDISDVVVPRRVSSTPGIRFLQMNRFGVPEEFLFNASESEDRDERDDLGEEGVELSPFQQVVRPRTRASAAGDCGELLTGRGGVFLCGGRPSLGDAVLLNSTRSGKGPNPAPAVTNIGIRAATRALYDHGKGGVVAKRVRTPASLYPKATSMVPPDVVTKPPWRSFGAKGTKAASASTGHSHHACKKPAPPNALVVQASRYGPSPLLGR